MNQKYYPAIVISVFTVIGLYFASRKSGPVQAVNRIIPASTGPGEREPIQENITERFATLANAAVSADRLKGELASIQAQSNLGQYRLQESSLLARLGLEATNKQTDAAVEIARINAQSRAYDAEAQLRAIDRMNAGNALNNALRGLGNLLGALLKPSGGSSGGSSGGGSSARTPPTFPNAPSRRPSYPTRNNPLRLPDAWTGGTFPDDYIPSFIDYSGWFPGYGTPDYSYPDWPIFGGSYWNNFDPVSGDWFGGSGELTGISFGGSYWDNFDPDSGDWIGEIGGTGSYWDNFDPETGDWIG